MASEARARWVWLSGLVPKGLVPLFAIETDHATRFVWEHEGASVALSLDDQGRVLLAWKRGPALAECTNVAEIPDLLRRWLV